MQMLRFIYALDAVAPPSYGEQINDELTSKPIIGILILVGALLLSAGMVTWAIITRDKSVTAPAEQTTEEEDKSKE